MPANIFAERLDLSPIAGAPIIEDEHGDGCYITLPGNTLNTGVYNISLPIDGEVQDDQHAAKIKVGDAESGWVTFEGDYEFPLTVTSGSEIKLSIFGVRVRLSQVSVALAA